MATLPHKVCSSTMLLHAVGMALVLPLLAAAGCASRTYRAANLPPEYLAPVTENIEELNLSKLADFSVSSQRIDCGDVLEVTILTDSGSDKTPTVPVVVERDGTADIPPVGKVHLAGLDLEEAGPRIAAAGVARRKFQRPHVTVEMKRQRTNMIQVIGAVEEPGLQELPRSHSSLLAAISAAGGLSEDASGVVEIRRPPRRDAFRAPFPPQPPHVAHGPRAELTSYPMVPPGEVPQAQVIEINLSKAAKEGYGGGDLIDGDIVYVHKRAPKPVYVIGLVQKPDEYEMPANQDMHMLDALAKAGGRSLPVADKVMIRRRVPGEEPIVIVTSISAAMRHGPDNVLLAPGDTVSVEETPATVVMRTFTQVLRIGVGSNIPLF